MNKMNAAEEMSLRLKLLSAPLTSTFGDMTEDERATLLGASSMLLDLDKALAHESFISDRLADLLMQAFPFCPPSLKADMTDALSLFGRTR